MKVYFADTNVFLRFLIRDNQEQFKVAKKHFDLARAKKIRIIIVQEILFEMVYVLVKVYDLSRVETGRLLLDLVSSGYFEIKDRELFIKSFEIYMQTNLDLVDIFLFEKAKQAGGEVLSFDRDFEKLAKLESS